eukprot:3114598-Karenia_brevis.AAC.1
MANLCQLGCQRLAFAGVRLLSFACLQIDFRASGQQHYVGVVWVHNIFQDEALMASDCIVF